MTAPQFMPEYLFNGDIWASIWPIFALALIFSILCARVFGSRGNRAPLALLLASFGILGGAIGFLTGASREPAVSAVIPAMLTLVGGLALFQAGRNKDQQTVIALNVAVLASTLLIATEWGADNRVRFDLNMRAFVENDRERQLQRASFTEAQINEFRESLGLKPFEFSDIVQEKKDKDDAKKK